MATERKKFESICISLGKLCKLARISYYDLYRRRGGEYKSELETNKKTRVANALVKDIEPFFQDLGFEIKITPTRG